MMVLRSSPSSLISSSKYLPCREIKASKNHVHVKTQKNHLPSGLSSFCNCFSCGRRLFLGASDPNASHPISPSGISDSKVTGYKSKLFDNLVGKAEKVLEIGICGYKSKLFDNLVGKAEKVLEIGIGPDPNLKYYPRNQDLCVFGVDPNAIVEKYARESAAETRMKPENFRFIQAVGEAIPLDDVSVDAVGGTLVLCSVSDVAQTLNEIKRVLKQGGLHIFVEHVAAEEGTFLRRVQNLLDPLEQLVLDGCHSTRHTEGYISEAGFDGGVEISTVYLFSIPWGSPHMYGVAYK